MFARASTSELAPFLGDETEPTQLQEENRIRKPRHTILALKASTSQ